MTSTMEQRACPAICAISTTPIFLCMGTGIGDYLVAGRQSAAELDTLYGHGNHLLAVCFRTKSRHCLSHVKHLLSPPQYYHRGGERTRARQRPGQFGKGDSMLTTLLGVAAVVCAIGWLKNRLALLSILYYIMWAELPEPSDEEIKYCAKKVAQRVLHIKDRSEL